MKAIYRGIHRYKKKSHVDKTYALNYIGQISSSSIKAAKNDVKEFARKYIKVPAVHDLIVVVLKDVPEHENNIVWFVYGGRGIGWEQKYDDEYAGKGVYKENNLRVGHEYEITTDFLFSAMNVRFRGKEKDNLPSKFSYNSLEEFVYDWKITSWIS